MSDCIRNLWVTFDQIREAPCAFEGTILTNTDAFQPLISGYGGGGGPPPVTTVTDTFNRADGGLGSNWTAMNAGGLLQIVSNAVTTTTGQTGASFYSGATFAADHFARVVMVDVSDGGGPMVRCQGAGSLEGYIFYVGIGGGPVIFRVPGFVQLGAAYGAAVNNGDTVELSVAGNVLTPSINGVALSTRTDATYSGGAPGLDAFSNAVRLGTFTAGPVA